MNNKRISYDNKMLIRINSRKVNNIIKHYTKHIGLTIYIAPVKMRIETGEYWYQPFEMQIDEYNDYIDYINYINEVSYYNCNNELGKYLKFYIEQK